MYISDNLNTLVNNYKMSPEAQRLLQETSLVLLVSVTGGGKNSLVKKLESEEAYYPVISHTTRQPRSNNGTLEENGKEYWFVSEEEMLNKLKQGDFVEAKVVHEQYIYGTSVDEIKKANESNRTALLEIEVQGVDEIVRVKPQTRVVFILPPNFTEWMRRLTERGSYDQDELRVRLQTAESELETALGKPYYTFVINDDLDAAAMTISTIITTESNSQPGHEGAVKKAWQLLGDVKHHLNS